MSSAEILIEAGEGNSIHFGNHLADEKLKKEGFEIGGDLYKVKTYKEITRLEKNGKLLYESVPGTTVKGLVVNSDQMSFEVEGSAEDAQITVELEADQEYKVLINDVQLGKVKANLSGKISFSVEFNRGFQKVDIKKM